MSALPLSSASYLNSPKFSALLDSLSLAEEECKQFRTMHVTQSSIESDLEKITTHYPSRISQKSKHKLDQYRGKPSIFKQFKLPTPLGGIQRSIPDHHKNPHKWTRYSLEDVSNANMSDTINAQTAYAYLNELKSRKKLTCPASKEKKDSMEICEPALFKSKKNINEQIQFRKPKDTTINTEVSAITPENNKPIFRNSEVVMPEYIVGQKLIRKISKKKKVSEAVDRSKYVKLDHLQYPEEEESLD